MIKHSYWVSISKKLALSFLLILSFIQPINAADWLYTMRPGDTLWTLCKQYTKEPNCWQKLGPLNNIDRDRAIPPGTRIRVPASWLKVPAATAKIEFLQGDVRYQLPGENELAAEEGLALTIGSTLVTGEGTVSLSFADGSSMVLEPNSQLELDTLSNFELNGMVDSTVRLNKGTVKTRVIKREPRSHFRTITPSAVAAVRGTEYRVNVVSDLQESESKKTTLVEVYQGLVDVGAEQVSFPVPANFGIVAKQGETLQEPVKLLDKPEFVAFPEQQTLLVDAVAKTVAPVLIEWQPVAQASGFQLNILADDLSDSKTEKLLKSYRTQEHQLNLNELSIGCYQLSLRAIDNLGLHGLAEQKRLCLNQQISTPLVNSKPSDLPEEPKVKITWDPSDDASMYRVELSNMQDFSTLLSSVNTIETSTMITRQDTELFVRVQAIGEHENYSNFSQSVWIPAQVRVEENDGWKVFIPIGLFLLGFL